MLCSILLAQDAMPACYIGENKDHLKTRSQKHLGQKKNLLFANIYKKIVNV